MPWTAEDSRRHTHRANSPAQQRQWAAIANNILQRTGDEKRAITGANAVLAKHPSQKKDKPAHHGITIVSGMKKK